jgi:hypothetical protein
LFFPVTRHPLTRHAVYDVHVLGFCVKRHSTYISGTRDGFPVTLCSCEGDRCVSDPKPPLNTKAGC